MKLWVWWLSFLAILIILTGILLTVMGLNNLYLSINSNILALFYGLIPKQAAGEELWWSFFGFGLLSTGNGIFLLYVALSPFRKMEKWAWLAVFISIMIWFTIGASISIMFLIYIDLVIYASILILTLLPLLFTQKAFIIRRDLI